MAQVQLNSDTGLFEAVLEKEGEGQEDGSLENQEELSDPVQAFTVEDTETSEEVSDDLSYDDFIFPLAAVSSTAAFTPTAWQMNLASGRSLGQHYLMYANRVYYSGSSSYWHYFLVLGDDIEYADDIYSYTDCDVYSYYSYSNTVYYDREIGSGVVDGLATLVYSDLYFDYVGTEPAEHSSVYVLYALLMVIIVLLILRGRSHV